VLCEIVDTTSETPSTQSTSSWYTITTESGTATSTQSGLSQSEIQAIAFVVGSLAVLGLVIGGTVCVTMLSKYRQRNSPSIQMHAL
jgi:hypothetical protein